VSELANLAPNRSAAFVGDSAFAHKGGVHVSAVERNPLTYEHVAPESVGNRRRVLVSDLSGRSNLLAKARELGLDIREEGRLLNELKRLEHEGFEFEAADASFELLVHKLNRSPKPYFELLTFRVIDEQHATTTHQSEATVRVRVANQIEHAFAIGTGPVNALDQALRRALEPFYPVLADVRLVDYKVRVIKGSFSGTASQVRVLITSSDGQNEWGTVGVSTNIVAASWQALVDSVEYKLKKDGVESSLEMEIDQKAIPA
ncbi:MAG: citramalate synthase, partial [Blastocatellia bacterium]